MPIYSNYAVVIDFVGEANILYVNIETTNNQCINPIVLKMASFLCEEDSGT